ncbi:preprotein translocase subunit YajC [Massilia sp. Dwa41.01b]|uniref:preprotein translocase subunit YajC n=1 Tax=unclassified Massilia TaxID=2609279 RepID=UPI001601FC68|nr:MULTISPECIES: preprotein translocase subunit YajC [unclassified Massilia]QNA87530.1 preprotein translocase subunit YajC [Massilia sp. Dwa41.01b]QNA98436.1 preprotein translocase subunit YajC [Massilia sp. Se16.2.3]
MFISNAYAQTTTAADPGLTGNLLTFAPFIIMFAVLYFLMIRPQQKRQKEVKEMIEGLKKGDEVVTIGGIVGRVTKVSDAYVRLEVANGVEIVVQKNAITAPMLTGTLKSL